MFKLIKDWWRSYRLREAALNEMCARTDEELRQQGHVGKLRDTPEEK